MLKDMGCNAIRTSHNMPSPELVELCDEMGFMMVIEAFDEWDIAKCRNGYHRHFNQWASRDITNMILHYRNQPCVVIWSISNEVPTQCDEQGYLVVKKLVDLCHMQDPIRPVTCRMDQVLCAMNNGFGEVLDIPGFNYRTQFSLEGYKKFPQKLFLGTETTSTVSSRGIYKFPVEVKTDALYADHQCSSYDMEFCNWSNLPDVDLTIDEDYE